MYRSFVASLTVSLLLFGCREPDIVHQYVPAAPDIALYDGVYFESMDGMETYKEIVIVPRLLKSKVTILFPDGTPVGTKDLSLDILNRHGIDCVINNDDGRGNYSLVGKGIYVFVTNHRARHISLDSDNSRPGPFAIELKGQKVVVPIKRSVLEALLGEPDEIKLKTFPEAQ